ncbi:uncharacterized protein LOC135124423 [Zophobas morio]|uniref:uncharacterized protein LOC135124423 n=1 Tax=Zophobas morio TaxID=2755281 RepID=UPI00308367E5
MTTSFNNLVQSKRTKMLTLSLLLTIAILVRQSTSINLTYIVKKEGEKLQPNCIAEENDRYSAIGWIYPLPTNEEEEPKITTKFVPTIQNEFNCKFSKQSKCNKIWALKNWEVDENSTRTLDLLFDTRWEDFPTVFTGNDTKEFEARTEIPSVFKAGISVRASENVELLLCEGWNPYHYPCYHLNISTTEIILRKFPTLPKSVFNSTQKFLDSYAAFANILSGDEWRNFGVSLDDAGIFRLLDVSVNRTVIEYEDKEALKPLYLLMRSEEPALWKIHQNQFMYTKTVQTSRLGPILHLKSKEMCVALYVSTCPTCSMSFFVVKDQARKFISEVEPSENFEWKLVKLKDDHIEIDKVNIFVETKFTKNLNQSEGFWAVDEVRVCHENEVKVTFLKLKDDKADSAEDISCQIVEHPKWRPKKLVYDKIQDFPSIQDWSNSTAIMLNWTQEDDNNQINYFITYKANDLCPEDDPNLKRIKSNGFLMTKHNELTIPNLIPYTEYSMTFSSMLHENEKQITVATKASDKPMLEEFPSRLNIQVKENRAFVSWDKIPCSSIYGPIEYAINVTNFKTNATQQFFQRENTIPIRDLEPYTLYTLQIKTGRSIKNIDEKTDAITSSFTTQPGRASAVQNFELYSVDKNSVSFRYELPRNSKGIPVAGQVTRCNDITFKKCKTANFDITRCKLWPKKYCMDVNNLIPNQKYTFRVSIRNDGTQFYGDEVKAEAFLDEQVPGAPSNITYNMVDCNNTLDYCHLNISWLHPFYQNGTINSFHIVLNGTDDGTTKNIQEVLKIFNSSHYLPHYEYQIKFIPYSTHYDLYVQSVNSKYKSEYAHTHVKTDDIGDHINQSPELLQTQTTSVTFKLPVLDPRLKSYTLTTVVQDFDKERTVPSDIQNNNKVAGHLCHNFGDTWILDQIEVSSRDSKTIDIGTGDEGNKHLEPKTQYCFTFIVTNKYRNSEHDVVYFKKATTLQSSIGKGGYNHLYLLLLLLFLIPIGFLAYRYMKKRRPRKARQSENKENVYESLPFEECEENCVTNDTYDHLLHK